LSQLWIAYDQVSVFLGVEIGKFQSI